MTDNQNPDAVRDAVNAAAPVKEPISEAVTRLSAMPSLEYERVRKSFKFVESMNDILETSRSMKGISAITKNSKHFKAPVIKIPVEGFKFIMQFLAANPPLSNDAETSSCFVSEENIQQVGNSP